MHRAAVHGDRFNAAVSVQQDGAAGGLVDPTRLHADVTAFDQIQTANAVLAAIFIEFGQDGRGRHFLAVDGDGVAFFELDLYELGGVGRIFRVHGALIDVIGRVLGRIFQHFALGGGVQQVCVDREGGLAAFVLGDGDLVLFGELQQFGARARSHSRQGAITTISGFSA